MNFECLKECSVAVKHKGLFTFVQVPGQLTGMSAAIEAALLYCGALLVLIAALHACSRKTTGPLRSRTVTLLQSLYRLQELAAGQTLIVLFREQGLSIDSMKES